MGHNKFYGINEHLGLKDYFIAVAGVIFFPLILVGIAIFAIFKSR